MTVSIEVGQIWRRKSSGSLYRIAEIQDGTGSNIVLRNFHDSRISRISESGLRKKMELYTGGHP